MPRIFPRATVMRAAVQRSASWVDSALVAIREVLKAWINELFHLGTSLATALTVLFMLVFHRPGALCSVSLFSLAQA